MKTDCVTWRYFVGWLVDWLDCCFVGFPGLIRTVYNSPSTLEHYPYTILLISQVRWNDLVPLIAGMVLWH